MTPGETTTCPSCGTESSGSYCPGCGASLEADGDRCPSCGSAVDAGAYFCTECGEPVRERPKKSLKAYLPWILSGLALLVFAVGITLLVQEQSAPRRAGSPPTGGVIGGGGQQMAGVDPEESGVPSSEGGGAAMPSAGELAEMSPRQAADRLFNRAMQMKEGGAPEERVRFFARMGVQAYRRVPASEVNADVRFHVGLLQLAQGKASEAAAEADTILQREGDNLLGLLLAARAAEARDESERAATYRSRLAEGVASTDLSARPAYEAHRTLLEEAAAGGP